MSVTINGTTGVTTNNSVYTDASGNTGIGTTSPATKLDVNGNIALPNATALQFKDSGGTRKDILQLNASSNVILQSPSASIFQINGSTEAMRIDSSGYTTSTVNGNGAGLVQGQQYYRLNAAVAGANATGAQSLFGVGVTLSASTVYEFEIVFDLSRSAGSTSHTIALSFAGTATINNILYHGYTNQLSSATPSGPSNSAGSFIANSASATVMTTSITTNNTNYFLAKGTVSINAGGTFIPQNTLSAAPGGAYSTVAGSYIKISALSASGANTSIGTWA